VKIVIVSGYFNPLHGGHLDMLDATKAMGDKLVVIVNNDQQQLLKKGKIILDEENRIRLVSSLRVVDEVLLSVDSDPGQSMSLRLIRSKYPDDELIFANGGDRSSTQSLPMNEAEACRECGIQTIFGVGSELVEKRDSSTRINQATGAQD
jgi:cytidyltransferase-like protein